MKDSQNGASPIRVVFKVASAVLLIALIAVSAISFSVGFDDATRYFTDSAANLPLIFTACLIVALSISSLFLFKGRIVKRSRNLLTGICAALPMIAVLRLILQCSWNALLSLGNAEGSADVWSVLAILTALLSVLYAVTELFDIGKATKLLAGYGQILFCIITIAKFYVDPSVELNSPIKLLVQLSAAAMILCTLSDLRELLGKVSAPIFAASRLLAASLGIASAFALFTEVLPNEGKYGEDYRIYILVFVLLAVKSCFELFCTPIGEKLEVKANEAVDPPEIPETEQESDSQ